MASDPRPIEKAPYEGRHLLGVLLAQRRAELGYTHVPAFVRARLPLTEKGNPNTRLAADIEKAYRDNFPEPRLRQLARAYLVDFGSLVAVAHGRARTLVPEPPAAPPAPASDTGWLPPISDPARIAAARPYADRIHARLRHLAAQGITDPDGRQVFGPGPDASTWDGTAGRWDLDERVWMIADMQRRDGGRDGSSGTGTG
jgi:hypothetical protein